MCTALVVALAFPAPAAAQGDVVFLRGGGRLRGTVEVFEPGSRVVILLPDGTRRTVSAAELERVDFADDALDAPARAPEAAPAPSSEVVSPPPMAEPEVVTPPSAEPEPAAVEQQAAPDLAPSAPTLSADDLARLEGVGSLDRGAADVYDDGLRASVPWNGVDPQTRFFYAPEGWLHAVIEVSGFAGGNLGVTRSAQVGVELAGGADARLGDTAFHVRLVGVLGLQTYSAEERMWDWHTQSATGFGYAALRATLGADLTSWFALRLGGDYGFEVVPVFDLVRIYGGPRVEAVFRVLDERRLELGISFALQDRSDADVAFLEGALRRTYAGTSWSPRGALTLGVLLP